MLTIAFVDVILLIFMINWTKDHKKINYSSLGIWIVLFGIINILAAAFSITLLASIKVALVILSYLAFYFVMINTVKDTSNLHLIIYILILSASIQSLYGIYQYIAGFYDRVPGTLDNPNILSQFLVLIIPISFGMFWFTKDIVRKAIFLGSTLLMLICLILTYSRGGWLAFAFSIIVFGILKDRRILLIACIFGILSIYFLPGTIIDRIVSIGDLGQSTTAERIIIWKASITMIKDYWFTGVGLGAQAFEKIYNNLYYVRTIFRICFSCP
jgi:O-antigen ligase